MFISSALITTLFFGGYNYPGIQWVGENWGENAAGIISIVAFLAKAFLFVFIFYVDKMDFTKIPLRPVNALRMEIFHPVSAN